VDFPIGFASSAVKVRWVIDLHAHVLPGVDDGPATEQEAVEVAAAAAAEGVRTLVATPHVRPDHPRVRPDELADRTRSLQAAVGAAGVELELLPGGEVDLVWAQTADDRTLREVSIGGAGRYLLVETPYGELPGTFEDLLFQVAARGYGILLAHPERSPTLQRTPERAAGLAQRGIMLQLTAAAVVTPPDRSRSRRLARRLLVDGVAHVLASDRHGSAIGRAGLDAAVGAASQLVGERAGWMVRELPAALLAGEPPPRLPEPRRQRRWRVRG
jgi:protein-tyrosine phosphatase